MCVCEKYIYLSISLSLSIYICDYIYVCLCVKDVPILDLEVFPAATARSHRLNGHSVGPRVFSLFHCNGSLILDDIFRAQSLHPIL